MGTAKIIMVAFGITVTASTAQADDGATNVDGTAGSEGFESSGSLSISPSADSAIAMDLTESRLLPGVTLRVPFSHGPNVLGFDVSFGATLARSSTVTPTAPAEAGGGDSFSQLGPRVGVHLLTPWRGRPNLLVGGSVGFGLAATGNANVPGAKRWFRLDARGRIELTTARSRRVSGHLFAEACAMVLVRDGAQAPSVEEPVYHDTTHLGASAAVGAGLTFGLASGVRARLDLVGEVASINLKDGVPGLESDPRRDVGHTDLRVMMVLGVEW